MFQLTDEKLNVRDASAKPSALLFHVYTVKCGAYNNMSACTLNAKFTKNPPHLSGLNVYANERVLYIVKQIKLFFSALLAKNASIFLFHFKRGTSRIYIRFFPVKHSVL